MKKTYDVYSIFGKTDKTRILKSFLFMFVFSVCLVGVTSEASAQTFTSTSNGANGQSGHIDATFLKDFQFDDSEKESAVLLLRGEMQSLSEDPSQGGVTEAEWAARNFYLNDLIDNLAVAGSESIVESSVKSYRSLVQYVAERYTVYVDTEEIATYYSSLIDQ